jgi:hypothetical protein
MMTDREALDQVERLIADCKNRIASQREVIANPSNQRTGTPAQLDAFSLRRTCSAISSMRSSIRASPEPCPLQIRAPTWLSSVASAGAEFNRNRLTGS